ncbi:hypothetical protein BGM19_02565 [Streptomyces agglomeratus]|uniref:hypothetical protein n=1 Tax=Streptomyces agglomeratus TaxID=285458 RepID=UPI0008524E51|nr:hypothetical protein [Streptomyces agglomeratus]OEJ57052.1 hypothetical protein BGM19_02565 [Streptomyces agglomeratus]
MSEVRTHAVQRQLYLGRKLPLGRPDDGTWITEHAAAQALRRPAAEIPGLRVETLRIGPAPLEPVSQSAVRPPAGALPPGPLRIEATLTASTGQPLPHTAEQLRTTLLNTAAEQLGLPTVAVDLRVTDLLEGPEANARARTPDQAVSPPPEMTPARSSPSGGGVKSLWGRNEELADAAAAVAGVARLTAVLGNRPVTVEHRDHPPGRHIQVQLAVAPGHHPLDVARAVRAAVSKAATRDTPGPATVTVLITETAANPGANGTSTLRA